MSSNTILIIDSDKSRIQGIIKSFQKTQPNLEYYRYFENELSLFHQEKGFIQPEIDPRETLIVLRHGRNSRLNTCNGVVNICYSGAGGVDGDILKHEKNFYPKVDHSGMEATYCKELVDYASKLKDGVKTKEPECIYPRKEWNLKIAKQYDALVHSFDPPADIQYPKEEHKNTSSWILVIWNTFSGIENTSAYYGHNVIHKRKFTHCAYDDDNQNKYRFHVIDHYKDLFQEGDILKKTFEVENKKTIPIHDFKEIHILSELNWRKKEGEYRYADFLGLRLATDFLFNRVPVPIILFSNVTKQEYIQLREENHSDLDLRIFDVLGSNLVCLSQEQLEFDLHFPKRYADHTLNEIIYYGLKTQGRIENILHTLCSSPGKIDIWFKQLQLIIPKAKHHELAQYEEEIRQTIETKSDTAFRLLLREKFREQIIQLLPDAESVDETGGKEEKKEAPWQVLLVEDQTESMEKTCQLIERSGIYCSCAQSSKEAISILKKNNEGSLTRAYHLVYDQQEGVFKRVGLGKVKEKFPVNHITVIICDLRLVDKDGLWNGLQGFELIHQLVYDQKKSNHLSYFILTEKEKGLNNLIQGNTNIRIHEFLKIQIDDKKGRPDLFLSILKREGQFIYDGSLRDLEVGSWNKAREGHFKHPVRKYYEWHRAKNYVQNELEINKKALRVINSAVLANNENEVEEKIEDFPNRTARMLGELGEEKSMFNLRERLICRRVVIGLLAKGLDKVKMLRLFHNRGYFGINKQLRNRFETEFKNSLFFKGLSWDFILKNPKYLLPEESLFIENIYENPITEYLEQAFLDSMGVIFKRIASKASFTFLSAILDADEYEDLLDKSKRNTFYFEEANALSQYMESLIKLMLEKNIVRKKVLEYRSGNGNTLYKQSKDLFKEYEKTIYASQLDDLFKRFLETLKS